MMDKICIIGVGLIGASFSKGLKKAGQVACVTGFGRNEYSLQQAKAMGAIDDYCLDIKTALSGAQLVVIATPVNSFRAILELIKPHINAQMIISDVGSTKQSVIQIAKSVFGELPENFIPAHPIAGKEQSGARASEADLFQNRRVILTPEPHSNSTAIATVRKLWQSVGAVVEIMDAQTHDDLLAMTSHLPHLLAFGLMDYLLNKQPNVCDYAAGGFRDFSRIASSDAVMWRDICLNNGAEIVKHIEGYQQVLSKLSGLIEGKKSSELKTLFAEAKSARDGWLDKSIAFDIDKK